MFQGYTPPQTPVRRVVRKATQANGHPASLAPSRPFDHSGHISCAAQVSTIAKRLVILAGQGGVKLSGASISRVLAPPPVYLSNGVIADTLCEPDQSWTRYRVKRIRLQGSTCDGAELCSLCFGMLSNGGWYSLTQQKV